MTETVDETIADMTAAGAFGPNSRLVSFELGGRHTEQDQFASCVFYGTATVDDGDGQRHRHQLVFKFKHPTPEMRDLSKNDHQFHNETLFYERIAPFLLAHGSHRDDDGPAMPSLCHYFYGRKDCGDLAHRDVIVLEHESVRGYRAAVTGHRIYLDFDHLIVALRTLAKFHGLSYWAKHENPMKFAETVADVKEIQWSKDGEWVIEKFVIQGLISAALDRVKERYSSCGGDNKIEWIGRFQSELLDDVIQTLRSVAVPVEPQAVLCHGDFNRNNLLFRYDDTSRPVDALAYDMGAIQYGSPALDLSFFLYMNTDRQTRDDYWDELLDAYCATLAMYAGDVPVPGRDQLDAEMREHGFYGLAHVSFFLRVMLDETHQLDTQQYLNFDDSQKLHWFLLKGGDMATEWIADAVQHFVRCRYSKTYVATNTTTNGASTPIEILI